MIFHGLKPFVFVYLYCMCSNLLAFTTISDVYYFTLLAAIQKDSMWHVS